MSSQQKENQQSSVPEISINGLARMQNLPLADRRKLRKAIGSADREFISALLDQPISRELLPADGNTPRICSIAEIWCSRYGDPAEEEALMTFLTEITQSTPLSYIEYALLPQAFSLQFIRMHAADTNSLCSALRAIADIDWESCIADIVPADKLLLKDPQGTYAQLAVESRRNIRYITGILAKKAHIAEEDVVSRALELCSVGKNIDVTQLFLTDTGLKRLQDSLKVAAHRQFRLHPDPEGRWIFRISLALCTSFTVIWVACTGHILSAIVSLPLFWRIGRALFDRISAAIFPSYPLPRMEIPVIPQHARTLAVVPARISNMEELQARMDELAAHAALYRDDCMEYLLLADLADAPEKVLKSDASLIEQSVRLTDSLGPNFHVLWRPRSYNPADQQYQPRERKRGAIMELCALLTGATSSLEPSLAATYLRDKQFRYIILMDAGTQPYPESLRKLVGTMLWPGNRYAILQPAIRSTFRRYSTRTDRCLLADCGVERYSDHIGNLYQTLTGRSIYGGKGIIDIAQFRYALEDRLPDNAVLSHDLIEGAIAGAGYAGDALWLEEQPATLRGLLTRFERWTRGDWQLLPFLLDQSQPLDFLARFQMADNLICSLTTVASVILLIKSALSGVAAGIILAILPYLLPLLLDPMHISIEKMVCAACEIALLPIKAFAAAQAIIRALYRTFVSHAHMLDWKTAAGADSGDISIAPAVAAVILLMPALRFVSLWLLIIPLLALFLILPVYLQNHRQAAKVPPLADQQNHFLEDLAGRTWLFFEENVTETTHHLPPDNVQLDPPKPPANRTSPTNIGMYLLSCLSAAELQLISRETYIERVEATLQTLEMLPKWHGLFYNWYDIYTLQLLEPKFISAVDTGNLAACLMAIAGSDMPSPICKKALALAEGMDLAQLYDGQRHLFCIGYNPATASHTAARYDLFASESRLLSLCAIAMGKIPAKHWLHLARPLGQVNDETMLLSWSGTMFEYLMPDLLFDPPDKSAWARTSRNVTDLQTDNACGGLWGVSESGCCDFDAEQNYGYRAFGMRKIALDGETDGGVFAPYATALALKYRPQEAADTLIIMDEDGYSTHWGMIEAVDMRSGNPRAVRSHMSHHQGMLLCAVCNCLTQNILCRKMERLPEIRAITPLLQDRHDPRQKPIQLVSTP